MTRADAEQIIRDLMDRHGSDPQHMPEHDLHRLHQAIDVLGQERVFEIAEDQKKRQAG